MDPLKQAEQQAAQEAIHFDAWENELDNGVATDTGRGDSDDFDPVSAVVWTGILLAGMAFWTTASIFLLRLLT